jgi:hypothetical protein
MRTRNSRTCTYIDYLVETVQVNMIPKWRINCEICERGYPGRATRTLSPGAHV